jgi:hypothetical protein
MCALPISEPCLSRRSWVSGVKRRGQDSRRVAGRKGAGQRSEVDRQARRGGSDASAVHSKGAALAWTRRYAVESAESRRVAATSSLPGCSHSRFPCCPVRELYSYVGLESSHSSRRSPQAQLARVLPIEAAPLRHPTAPNQLTSTRGQPAGQTRCQRRAAQTVLQGTTDLHPRSTLPPLLPLPAPLPPAAPL